MMLTNKLPIAMGVPGVCAKGVTPGLWAEVLDPWMAQASINTPKRIAAFIGNVSVESGGFSALSENLNYSAERIVEVWPSHFAGDTYPGAGECAHNPEMLANIVYANRGGNGLWSTGDGWRYRGAGLIQLTFKENQMRFAQAAKVLPEQVGDYLRQPRGAAQSACWFWTDRKLNPIADAWMLTGLTRTINGGLNGLQQRISLCNAILEVIT